jgi:hypothetical protein
LAEVVLADAVTVEVTKVSLVIGNEPFSLHDSTVRTDHISVAVVFDHICASARGATVFSHAQLYARDRSIGMVERIGRRSKNKIHFE